MPHVQRTVGPDRGDGPPVAVGDEVGGRQRKATVVAAGDDHVTLADCRAVGERDPALGRYCGSGQPCGLGAEVQLPDLGVGGCDQQRVQPRCAVGGPRGERLVGGRGGVADMDPAVVEVVAEAGRVAAAQGQGGGGFGAVRAAVRVAEPAHLGEGDGAVGALDVAEHPAGADRGELPVVADEPHRRAALAGVVDDGGEVERAGHARLVDDQQAAGPDRVDPVGDGRPCPERVDELGERVGCGDAVAEFLAQDAGRRGGRGEADDGVAVGGPGGREGAERGRSCRCPRGRGPVAPARRRWRAAGPSRPGPGRAGRRWRRPPAAPGRRSPGRSCRNSNTLPPPALRARRPGRRWRCNGGTQPPRTPRSRRDGAAGSARRCSAGR